MEISTRSFYVLLVMKDIAKRNRVAMSQKKLSAHAKISVITLRRSLNELRAKGIINKEVVRGFRKNFFVYTITKEKKK